MLMCFIRLGFATQFLRAELSFHGLPIDKVYFSGYILKIQNGGLKRDIYVPPVGLSVCAMFLVKGK